MAMNTYVHVVGNAVSDPSLRFTPNGTAVANFAIAVNNRRMNKQTNQWEDGETEFFDVTCWSQMAENASESIVKGSRVMVWGRLQQQKWETEGGDKRSKIQIVADEVGPSLRWANATVVKNERREGGESQSRPANDPPFEDEPF
jgi:single-strand DNA-binding protein